MAGIPWTHKLFGTTRAAAVAAVDNPKTPFVGRAAQPTLYHYHKSRLHNTGTQNLAFEPLFHKPLYSVIGTGTQVGSLRLPNPPALAVPTLVIAPLVPGNYAGTLQLQGLSEADTLSGVS